jgi:hypothetical protein
MEAVSVLFSLASMCLVIAGAASPWLSFQAPNAPQLTFGLLTFCSSGNCVAMSQAPYTGDLCELKAAAALLFIAFIFAFLSLLTGATLAAGSDALIADHKLKIVFSLSALLLTFIGCVIACNQVRASKSLGRGPAALLHPLFLTTPLPHHRSLLWCSPGVPLLHLAKQPVHVPGQRAQVHAAAWVFLHHFQPPALLHHLYSRRCFSEAQPLKERGKWSRHLSRHAAQLAHAHYPLPRYVTTERRFSEPPGGSMRPAPCF